MFGRPVDYLFNGGMAGTGARFNGKELLLNLSDLGIKATSNGFGAEQMKMLFFLKREAARQLLHGEGWQLPVWLDEGLGECIASWPYAQGHYSLQNLDAAMGDHLAKARKPADRKSLHLFTPAKLMPLPWDQWRELDPAETAASAGVFVQYWLFHDGKGDGAGLAAYLNALRRGTAEPEAEAKFLLRGRKREELAEEVRKLAQRLVPDAVVE
jgi:hypothetical protein